MSTDALGELPDLDTLEQWLEQGDARLDALQARFSDVSDPSAAARWDRIQDRLDRPVAPAGLPPAVLDALHAALQPAPEVPPVVAPSPRRWPWAAVGGALALAAAAVLVVLPGPEPTVLLTPAEVEQARPPLTRGTQTPPATRGPEVEVATTVAAGTLGLRIDARPGPDGVPVDPGSLRLRYGALDLTERLGELSLPLERTELVVAPGRHRFEVSLADVSGQRRTVAVDVVVP